MLPEIKIELILVFFRNILMLFIFIIVFLERKAVCYSFWLNQMVFTAVKILIWKKNFNLDIIAFYSVRYIEHSSNAEVSIPHRLVSHVNGIKGEWLRAITLWKYFTVNTSNKITIEYALPCKLGSTLDVKLVKSFRFLFNIWCLFVNEFDLKILMTFSWGHFLYGKEKIAKIFVHSAEDISKNALQKKLVVKTVVSKLHDDLMKTSSSKSYKQI